jgi:hypothetical protein
VGAVGALAPALAVARHVSTVAPWEDRPTAVLGVPDLFVELGVGGAIDDWLAGLAERLRSGPDLIATLDRYYRNDMNRAATATQLRIHPRTLDYRLARVLELTGEDPGSTRGVRILTTAVNRSRAAGGGG